MSFALIILILHVFGAGLVIGIVLLALYSVLRPPVTAQAMDRLHFVSRLGIWGSGWQFVTGLILAWHSWSEFRTSPVFWTKMGLYVVEGLLASSLLGRLSKQTWEKTANGQTTSGGPLRLVLVLHAALILAIAALGVVLVTGGQG